MADFNKAFKKLLPVEGGYVNNSKDRGGETYKGISRKYWATWLGWEIIDSLRKEPNFPKNLVNHERLQNLVNEFYKLNFWDKISGDAIINQSISEELFDSSVNVGVSESIHFLQASLNILNRNGKLFPDITDDGKMGPKTLQQLNDFDEEKHLLRALNSYQGAYYIELLENDPSQEEFTRGWLIRASSC